MAGELRQFFSGGTAHFFQSQLSFRPRDVQHLWPGNVVAVVSEFVGENMCDGREIIVECQVWTATIVSPGAVKANWGNEEEDTIGQFWPPRKCWVFAGGGLWSSCKAVVVGYGCLVYRCTSIAPRCLGSCDFHLNIRYQKKHLKGKGIRGCTWCNILTIWTC